MRVLLFTGKGGVGKTSVAAASALRAASQGARTRIMSTDPAHSLADVLGVRLGPEPVTVAPGLLAEQLEPRGRLEERWEDIRAYLVSLLHWGGMARVAAEELALLPGLEELFALEDVRRHADSGDGDLLVVDCAPTAETLRLLSLPQALAWYLERAFPLHRRIAGALRPVLERTTSMPLPSEGVLDAVAGLHGGLRRVQELLTDPGRTTVRLVLNPEAPVVAEAQRTYTALCLFGYHVDAVVANRVLPEAVTDPWFDRWKVRQRQQMEAVRQGFTGLPLLSAPLLAEEPLGPAALRRLGDTLYAGRPVTAVLARPDALRIEARDGGYVLRLALPFAQRGAVDVLRRDETLYVKVAGHTRSLALPAALRQASVRGARLADGVLEVSLSGAGARGGEEVVGS